MYFAEQKFHCMNLCSYGYWDIMLIPKCSLCSLSTAITIYKSFKKSGPFVSFSYRVAHAQDSD